LDYYKFVILYVIIKNPDEMTPECRIETEKHIKAYLKSFNIKAIINIKCEITFNDLGLDVNVWNVKTKDEAFWVVEG